MISKLTSYQACNENTEIRRYYITCQNVRSPPPPEKPTPNECCGSGCVPCIYDYYYDALEKWQERYGSKGANEKVELPDQS